MSNISPQGLLDLYQSPPSTCLGTSGFLRYAFDEEVYSEWWMHLVEIHSSEWEKIKGY